ncbi:MAG: histidine kinase [Betaproteobacteria bacterium]|nr:histidine kinase [Betaproteobacteria bacterium]
MDKKISGKIWTGIVGFSRRVADFVAQLTNWQFIFLGLLALIAAAILESILNSHSSSRDIPPVSVIINKEEPQPADKDTAADLPEPPPPPEDAQDESLKQLILKEVQKEIEKESAATDPSSPQSKKSKKSVKVHIGGSSKKDYVLPLAQITFFLIVILLAMRITTRSRQRAEKRVMSAEASAEMESLRRQVTEAQLQTLQAQVEPHFLFNTLAAVEHLTETDPPRASVMLQHLIAFLRGSLPDMREKNTTLGREVDLCRSYLAIMQIRMEDRLAVSINVPEALRGLSFPPMMLQSLVENSIKHGLEPKPAGGAIALSAHLQEGRLRVTVADTGLGIAENAPQGIGLTNIRDRLKRLYSNTAALVLAPNAPTGAHITIEIPYVNTPAPASNPGR